MYRKLLTITCYIVILIAVSMSDVAAKDLVHCKRVVPVGESSIKLCVGDLLFQDLNCGTLCNGINQVTYGVDNTYISHVAMVVNVKGKEPYVIEAVSRGVVITPFRQFLARSVDSESHPRVVVERLTMPYRRLIPQAVKYALAQLHKPYNTTFVPNSGQTFYCSQLIYAAFKHANHQQAIFQQHAMSFVDPRTGQTESAWLHYFATLHATIPEGSTGTNPGMLSRESDLIVIRYLGHLRQH